LTVRGSGKLAQLLVVASGTPRTAGALRRLGGAVEASRPVRGRLQRGLKLGERLL